MPPVRGLPRERRTGRRVRADLTDASSSELLIWPAAFRRTAGLCLKLEHPLRSRRRGKPGGDVVLDFFQEGFALRTTKG